MIGYSLPSVRIKQVGANVKWMEIWIHDIDQIDNEFMNGIKTAYDRAN